jgi:hypothetical protein
VGNRLLMSLGTPTCRATRVAVSTLIEFLCAAHPHVQARGPKVTQHERAWAVCLGRGDDAHDWVAIEPTRPDFLTAVISKPVNP